MGWRSEGLLTCFTWSRLVPLRVGGLSIIQVRRGLYSSTWQAKYGLGWGILIPQASKPRHWMISSTCFKGGLYDKGAPYTSGVSNWMCTIGISPNHVFWPNSGLTLRPWCWNRGWQAWQQRDGSNFWVIKCLPNSSWAEIHCWYAIIDKAWEGQVVLAPKWVDDCDFWCTLKMRGRTSERLLRHAVETWYARAPL